MQINEKAKHTPGPWEYDQNGKIWGDVENEALDGDSPLLAEMFGWGAEQRANARLIAAAPELLEALKEVVAIADRKTNEFDRARAAIAKATGSEAA